MFHASGIMTIVYARENKVNGIPDHLDYRLSRRMQRPAQMTSQSFFPWSFLRLRRHLHCALHS